MTARPLVERHREQGVLLGLRGEELCFLAESGMTPELRARLDADRDRLLAELSADAPGGRGWRQRAKRQLWLEAFCQDIKPNADWLDDQLEAVEERAAILEYDAGLSREEAEERALQSALAALAPAREAHETAARPFIATCDLSVPRHPHDPPPRGCYSCDGRDFVRVAGGPAWFCPKCHPPMAGAEVVERWTAPEPSWWEVRRGR